MIEPVINVLNLTKSYGKFLAVDNVGFEVQPGEIFGLLGPNGAGKTTTLETRATFG
jgi:ABC-2 type transport system ATP-binding protein